MTIYYKLYKKRIGLFSSVIDRYNLYILKYVRFTIRLDISSLFLRIFARLA